MGLHHLFILSEEVIPHKAGGAEALVKQAGIAAVLGIQAVADVSVRHETDINPLLENYTKPHCYCVLLSTLSTFVYKSPNFPVGSLNLTFLLCFGTGIFS